MIMDAWVWLLKDSMKVPFIHPDVASPWRKGAKLLSLCVYQSIVFSDILIKLIVLHCFNMGLHKDVTQNHSKLKLESTMAVLIGYSGKGGEDCFIAVSVQM